MLKTPCRRFEQYGSCQFAGNCKYTHYSPEELCALRQEVEYIINQRQRKFEAVPQVPSIESWLEKYNEKVNKQDNSLVQIFWNYPDQLELRTDLPPSLKKMKPEHFLNDNFEEWGS